MTNNMIYVHRVRAHLAKLIIYVFIAVTALLFLSSAAGFLDWRVIKEMLQTWSATYSLLVGAVIGYYFGTPNAGGD